MRALDAQTIEGGVPGEVLMERAGVGLAGHIDLLIKEVRPKGMPVVFFAGKGNNGGDAFVAARVLKERGRNVELLLAASADDLKGDALTHYNLMLSSGVVPRELPDEKDWAEPVILLADSVLVDGLLGTGVMGAPRGVAALAIKCINNNAHNNMVVAIDAPSGINTDTGVAAGDVVTADITVTMALPKLGLVEQAGLNYTGRLEIVDIGIPLKLIEAQESSAEFIAVNELSGLIPRRDRSGHKGSFGSVLVVGGAKGYAGAAALASLAALRSGAGLVTALVPSGIVPEVLEVVPEAMVHGLDETQSGSLAKDALDKWDKDINDFDVVLIGPGMTTHEDTKEVVKYVLARSNVPVIVDADALNVCAKSLSMLKDASAPVIITPHPGEMGRLMDCSSSDVQSDRPGMAQRAVDETGSIVVLKGAATIVAAAGRPPSINMTGNPGMASGGMGDVLGGLIAGLVAQGVGAFDATRMAVYVHGCAGDAAAWRMSQAGTIATDVITELSGSLAKLTIR